MDRPHRLTAGFVKDISTAGRYGDGRGGFGLSLLVKPAKSGMSKTWAQRLRVGGKVRTFGLGAYPMVTLAAARQTAATNYLRVQEAEGRKSALDRALEDAGLAINTSRVVEHVNPTPTVSTAMLQSVPTFAQVADETLAMLRGGWKVGSKTEHQWTTMLGTYVLPAIGDLPINEVQSGHIVDILSPIWHAKQATAAKTKRHIGQVMQFAVSKGYRTDNPTDVAKVGLPKKKRQEKHHEAIPFAEMGAFIDYLRNSRTYKTKKLGTEFLILTCTRTTEARAATWNEIDLDARVWTLAADRMKGEREHRIPLSDRAMEILREASELRTDNRPSALVFPDPKGNMLGVNGFRAIIRRKHPEATTHGMRSSFRDWAAECTDAPREIVELCLAHVEGTESELAYRRTDYFEKRREIMQAWSDYVC